MTIVVKLDPETEARLTAEAEANGMAVGEYALAVLRSTGPLQSTALEEPHSDGLEKMFAALAKESEKLPVLPPEAFERENFYEDRW